MAIDSNELLIFKKRGLTFPEAKPIENKQPEMKEETIAKVIEKVQKVEQIEAPAKRITGKNARIDIAMAQGTKCFNHPWRDAYAVCDICRRSFCYADLVSHNGTMYCLEDIGQAAKFPVAKTSRSIFSYVSALLFIGISGYLAYQVYPESTLLINHIQQIGVSTFLSTPISYGYAVSLFNTSLVAIGVFSFFTILMNTKRTQVFSTIAIGLMLLAFSYEYFNNTNASYFLILTLASFVCIWTVLLSKASAIGTSILRESVSPEEIEWPRVETF